MPRKRARSSNNNNNSTNSNKKKAKSTTTTRKAKRPIYSDDDSSNDNASSDDEIMWSSSSRNNSRSSRSSKSSSSSSSSSKMEKALTKWFDESYGDEEYNKQVATLEGISTLSSDLQLDPLEDVGIVVLIWKLLLAAHSSSSSDVFAKCKPAQITRYDFVQGCLQHQIDSLDKLKSVMLPMLDVGFMERSEFKDFYKFCFHFNRQGTHKTLEKEMVLALLPLALANQVLISNDRIKSFCSFLESTTDYTRITQDQWTSFFDFCLECPTIDDLEAHDEATSAWPVMMDDYVDYLLEQEKKK